MASQTISVSSKRYEDEDDCLSAAAAEYVEEHPELAGYSLCPRWEGGDAGSREAILLDLPAWFVVEGE